MTRPFSKRMDQGTNMETDFDANNFEEIKESRFFKNRSTGPVDIIEEHYRD